MIIIPPILWDYTIQLLEYTIPPRPRPFLCSITKNPDGNIWGTKRATRDPLVTKQPDFLGIFGNIWGT